MHYFYPYFNSSSYSYTDQDFYTDFFYYPIYDYFYPSDYLDYFYFFSFYQYDYNQNGTASNVTQSSPASYNTLRSAVYMVGWMAYCIEVPAIILAAYALYQLVKPNQVAPLFVINLLISDLLQVIIRPAFLMRNADLGISQVFYHTALILKSSTGSNHTENNQYSSQRRLASASAFLLLHFAIFVSIGFMVCIALERFLLVTYPIWYRCQRSLKRSVLISIAIWMICITYLGLSIIISTFWTSTVVLLSVLQLVYLLVPCPLLVFFFVGTWRALSHSVSVRHSEKKKVLGTLVLVFCNYALVFLPSATVLLWKLLFAQKHGHGKHLPSVMFLDAIAVMLLYMSPLLDILLYFFVGKNAKQILMVFPCCRRRVSPEENRSTISTVSGVLHV